MNITATTLQGAEEYTAILCNIISEGRTKKNTVQQTIDVRCNGETLTIDDFYAGNNPKLVNEDLGKTFRFKIWCSRGQRKTFYKAVLAHPEPVPDAELPKEDPQKPQNQSNGVDWAAKDRAMYRMHGDNLVAQLRQSFVDVVKELPSKANLEDLLKETCELSETFVVNYLTKGLQAAMYGKEADGLAAKVKRGEADDIPF